MASDYENFWTHNTFALIGDSASKKFPHIAYRKLKEQGKKVFPVDASGDEVDGDRAYHDLESLPEKPEAAVLELPKEETRGWVEKAFEAGIMNIWIHQNTDTPEALELARENGMNELHGTCAVLYLTQGFSIHGIHRWFVKRSGRY